MVNKYICIYQQVHYFSTHVPANLFLGRHPTYHACQADAPVWQVQEVCDADHGAHQGQPATPLVVARPKPLRPAKGGLSLDQAALHTGLVGKQRVEQDAVPASASGAWCTP